MEEFMTEYKDKESIKYRLDNNKKIFIDYGEFPRLGEAFSELITQEKRGAFITKEDLETISIKCIEDLHFEKEEFTLTTNEKSITIHACDWSGAFYGLTEILENLSADGELAIRSCHSYPDFSERGICFECLLYPDHYNLEHAKYIIRRLAAARINSFHIGFIEELLSFDQVVSPEVNQKRKTNQERISAVNEIIAYARLFGIACYAHYRVLTLPDDILRAYPETTGTGTTFCPSSPKLMEVFGQVIAEVPKVIPGINGLVLLLSEGNGNFFECSCPECKKRNESEIIESFWNVAQQAMGDKYSVVVRSYLSGWRNIYEQPWFTPLKDRQDMTIMTNLMRSDQFITHPQNHLIEVLPNLLIDIDLFGEYWGWGEIPCCAALYISENLNKLYDLSIRKISGRIGWVFHSTLFDSHNEVNFYLYSRILWDRKADPEQIVREYCARKYGREGAEVLSGLYMKTYSIVNKIFYVDGMCINSHSRPAENLRRFFYLMRDFSGAFFDDTGTRTEETTENFKKWFAEKDQALAEAKELLMQSKTLYGKLPEHTARYFENTFGEMYQTIKLWNLVVKAALSYRLYQLEPSELKKDDIKHSLMRYVKMGESQAWRAKLCDPGYAFGIFNDIREKLGEGLDPWAGYVPTGSKKQSKDTELHEFSGVSGYIDI